MLQHLRNKAQSIVVQVIIGIIILVFVFWGMGNKLFNSKESAITVNGEHISFQQYQQAYDRMLDNFKKQFGGSLPPGLAKSLGIKQQVINELVQEELLRQGAQEMGISISDVDIQNYVKAMPQFQEKGTFNLKRYKALLAANHYTPTKFENSIRNEMLSKKASRAITQFAGTATDQEIEELYRLQNSTVSYTYASTTPDDYTKTVTIDSEKMAAWYKGVADTYKTKPEMKLQYLDFSYTSVGKKITIDDEAIQSYYSEHKADFTTPEQRHARHILIRVSEDSSQETKDAQLKKAKKVLELAQQGKDFAELAKEYSEGPTKSNGGDLGYFGKGQMLKPFEDAVFSLKTGQISDIVTTTYGYHIIKLEDIQPEEVKSLEEVKPEIVATLQKKQAQPIAFQLANEAYEAIISQGSLENYLKQTPNAPVKTTEFFARANAPQPLAGDTKFLDAAFALKDKELSSLVETADGYAIIYATDVHPATVPELASIEEQVRTDYTSYLADQAAKEAATTLLKKAQKSGSLATTAEEMKIATDQSGAIGRDGKNDKGIPSSVTQAAFDLSQQEAFPKEPLKNGSDYYVIQFNELKAPTETISTDDKTRYQQAIIQNKKQHLLMAWLQHMQAKAKILTYKNL